MSVMKSLSQSRMELPPLALRVPDSGGLVTPEFRSTILAASAHPYHHNDHAVSIGDAFVSLPEGGWGVELFQDGVSIVTLDLRTLRSHDDLADAVRNAMNRASLVRVKHAVAPILREIRARMHEVVFSLSFRMSHAFSHETLHHAKLRHPPAHIEDAMPPVEYVFP